MDTDRAQRESLNAPGWKWIPEQGAWLWWDGRTYTARAPGDGSQEHVSPPMPAARPRSKPSAKAVRYGLFGVAIGLFLDLSILMAAANSPEDDSTWSNEVGVILLLAAVPVVGFTIGAAGGWTRPQSYAGRLAPLPKSSADRFAPGWKWIAKQELWLWWDGQRYTTRAVWDGSNWQTQGPTEEEIRRSRYATKSFVLGMVGLLFYWTVVVPFLAILFGVKSRREVPLGGSRWSGNALAGMLLGVSGLALAALALARMLI